MNYIRLFWQLAIMMLIFAGLNEAHRGGRRNHGGGGKSHGGGRIKYHPANNNKNPDNQKTEKNNVNKILIGEGVSCIYIWNITRGSTFLIQIYFSIFFFKFEQNRSKIFPKKLHIY